MYDKELYFLVLSAVRYSDDHKRETATAEGIIARMTEDEILRLAEERWPTHDGWHDHYAVRCKVPKSILNKVRPSINTKKEEIDVDLSQYRE